MHKHTARIFGIKIKVCSCIEVAVCKIPIKSPIIIAVNKIGNVTEIIVQIAAVKISGRLKSVTGIFYSSPAFLQISHFASAPVRKSGSLGSAILTISSGIP